MLLEYAADFWRQAPPGTTPNVIVSLNDGVVARFNTSRNRFILAPEEDTDVVAFWDVP
jgi:hypothetical protein